MRTVSVLLLAVALVCARPAFAIGEDVETRWGGVAQRAYDEGYAANLRRAPDGGVTLFDRELIENDAAGAGLSPAGAKSFTVWGGQQAKKVLTLPDPRTERAYLVLFTYTDNPAYPLTATINGEYSVEVTKDNGEMYRWAEFPPAALKAGENTVVLSCPRAAAPEEGWEIYLADGAEFEFGGGDGSRVGEATFASLDGGATWKKNVFGETGDRAAELSVRFSLDRYRVQGRLETPAIDLWRGDDEAFFVPLRNLRSLHIDAEADVPEGTELRYFLSRGTEPGPATMHWEPYEPIGDGAALHADFDGAAIHRRYVRVAVEFTTTNPTVAPTLKKLHVVAALKNTVDPVTNLVVASVENPAIRYPSAPWQWEKTGLDGLRMLREQENLDTLLEGAEGQFEEQLRLLDHAAKRWVDGNPTPDYPGWDALSILERIGMAGAGGMCIQSNNFLAGMCQAFGWQARHLNITSHEVCEVWSDEYGKWVYLDAHRVNMYVYDRETGEPLNMYDLHQRHLDRYYAKGPIDWMTDDLTIPAPPAEGSTVARGFPGAPWKANHDGVTMAALVRLIPRTNWMEQPTPRPLAHGMTHWPWDGYLNWYDERTPPKRQYSWHTDRKQDMWPDLNRVHIDATSGAGGDRLALHFETYTPNWNRFEADTGAGWVEVPARWMWYLRPGRNELRVRAVNDASVGGKPSEIVVHRHSTDSE